MNDTFTCDACGGTFEKAWTDEEAVAEASDLYGQMLDDPAFVCDDCFDPDLAVAVWEQER